MAAKEIICGTYSGRQMEGGIILPSNTLKVPFGPSGRNIVLDRFWSTPNITKNGVTVTNQRGNLWGSTKGTKGSCGRENARLAWTEEEWNSPMCKTISRVHQDPDLQMLKEPRSEIVITNWDGDVGSIISETCTGREIEHFRLEPLPAIQTTSLRNIAVLGNHSSQISKRSLNGNRKRK